MNFTVKTFIFYLFISSLFFNIKASSLNIGIRNGFGTKSQDRFDSIMKNFSSTLRKDIYSLTNYDNTRKNYNREVFLKKRLPLSSYDGSYIGFSAGNLDWEDFNIKNFTNEPFFTSLNFSFQSQFINFTYHYLWFFRKISIELGGGLGFSQAFLKTNGYSIYNRNREITRQNGVMIGNGLNYRLELLLNRPISNNHYFQIGFIAHHTLIPELTGSFNGRSASFFVNLEGQVIPLIETSNQNQSKFISSENYVSRLNISSTSFLFTLGIFQRLRI